MNRFVRVSVLLTLCLLVVAGLVLTGCSKKTAALQMPELEFLQYVKGTTVDFDDATLNSISEGSGEAGNKYGTAAAIYPSIYYSTDNRNAMAVALFGATYYIGGKATIYDDGLNWTTHRMLTAGDQLKVNGAIFATLPAAEQLVVVNSVGGFFDRQDQDSAAAKPLEQNLAYLTLAGKVSVSAAEIWKADAAVWLAKLNEQANVISSGKTYAQLSLTDKYVAKAVIGASYRDPETAFYRAMVLDKFRNGTASTSFTAVRDAVVADLYPTKSYAVLNPVLEKPVVDATVWAQLTDAEKAVVDATVSGMFLLAASQPADATNILYLTLMSSVTTTAADGWLSDVTLGKNGEWMFYKWMAFESFRNGTAASFYPDRVGKAFAAAKLAMPTMISAASYAECNAYEKILVEGVLWSGIPTLFDALPSGEQSYVLIRALPGMFGKVEAEMIDAVSLDQTICYLTLQATVTQTAADAWKKDVGENGVTAAQAYYRWLAKEGVSQSAGMALFVQESVGEFYIKITNPNKYEISIDKVNLFCRVTAGSTNVQVDAARQLVENVWIPANDEVVLKVLAPTMTMDVIKWMVTGGKDSNTARALATEVWTKIQAGTATWTVTAEATVSHGNSIEYETYTLTIA